MQYNIGIIVSKGHELDTWYVNKNANKKWYEVTSGPRGNEVITIICYKHLHDMSKKQSSTNYKCFSVINPIQTIQIKLNNFQKAIECNNLRTAL